MKNLKIILIIFAAFLFTNIGYSQPGQLDMTFGDSGKELTLVNGRSDWLGNDMLIQPDGKIVIGGIEGLGNERDLILVRLNSDGSMDRTFGLNGLVQESFPNRRYDVRSVVLQDDGKIIIGGYIISEGALLARFNSDGTQDNSFGINGRVILEDLENRAYFIYSLDIQNDGKIVAAGQVEYNNGDTETLFIRFNVNGSFDQNFGNNGILNLAIEGGNSYVKDVKVQSDGKIVAAGKGSVEFNNLDNSFMILRLNQFGLLDQSFGTDGVVITDLTLSEEAEDLILQPDGKYVITGYTHNANFDSEAILIRYNSDGSRDVSFGDNGIKYVDPTGSEWDDFPESLELQSDGKILVSGYTRHSDPLISDQYLFIARVNEQGVLDNSFGTNGVLLRDFGTIYDNATSIKERNDGKLIVSAFENNNLVSGQGYLNVLQYNSDGSVDDGFGENGMARVKAGIFHAEINSLIIQDDGKIVAAGDSDNSDHTDFSMVRYNSDGTLDNTFGNEGIVITEVGDSYSHAHSMGMQSDGKFILAGFAIKNGNNDFAVARYLPNGFLDNTFGTDGIVTTSIGAEDYAFSAVVQSDDKIILGGSTAQNQFDYALIRYNPDGSLDTQFGNNGIVTTQIGNAYDQINSLTIQNDGKIVAAGHSNYLGATNFTLARYNENGTLDNTFSDDGKVVTSVSLLSDRINSVKIQNDNKIVAAGYQDNGSDEDFAIARFDENGSLDRTFGTNGIVRLSLGSGDDRIESIEITEQNKIIAAGYTKNEEEYKYAVARFNSDGSLDVSFGNNGIMTTSFGISNDFARAVAIQEDGKIIAAGKSTNSNDYALFSLARFHGDGTTDIGDDILNKAELDFRLGQNYPNPFNPATTISYTIPSGVSGGMPSAEGLTTLKVYDILGKEIATLVSESKQPGTYEVEFSAENLPSGIYFYSLSVGNFSETKKMMLLK